MSVLIYESIKLNQHFCTNIKIKSSEVKMIVLKWKWNHYEKLISAQNRIKSSPCGFWKFRFYFSDSFEVNEIITYNLYYTILITNNSIFSQLDTKQRNCKIRNLQYTSYIIRMKVICLWPCIYHLILF